MFARLSVFAGGCTLEAAEAVLGGDDVPSDDVLDLLSGLVDKSLVVVDRSRAETRFDMYETIRQYAEERLVEAGDAEAVRARHGQWGAAFAREAGRGLYSPDELVWVNRLRDEIDNLQAAVGWAVAAGDTDVAMRMGASFVRQPVEHPLLGTAHLSEHALAVRAPVIIPCGRASLPTRAWGVLLRGDRERRARAARGVVPGPGGRRVFLGGRVYLFTDLRSLGRGVRSVCDGADRPRARRARGRRIRRDRDAYRLRGDRKPLRRCRRGDRAPDHGLDRRPPAPSPDARSVSPVRERCRLVHRRCGEGSRISPRRRDHGG